MSLVRRRNNMFPLFGEGLPNDHFLGLKNFFDFDGFFNRDFKVPPANITETETAYKVELSAPGLTRSDFKVELDDNVLTVSGEKEEENKTDGEHYRREFSYNSFSRSFQLPDNVKDEDINAKYDNGMLLITVPKKEPGKSRTKKAIDVI